MIKGFIVIRAGTPASNCRGCRARIYWALHPTTNKRHPVSVAAEGSMVPTSSMDGRGISHFADCPEAQSFRKRR